MADRDVSEKRTFTYEEAAALLPEVRRITEEAFRKVEALEGSPEEAAQDKINEIVTNWARAVLQHGIDVKGLWLVDFDNGSGYYCWQYPESGLQYYHSYEDGFAGRIRIH